MGVTKDKRVTAVQFTALRYAKLGGISGHVHGSTIKTLQRRGLLDGLVITKQGLAVLAAGRSARRVSRG